MSRVINFRASGASNYLTRPRAPVAYTTPAPSQVGVPFIKHGGPIPTADPLTGEWPRDNPTVFVMPRGTGRRRVMSRLAGAALDNAVETNTASKGKTNEKVRRYTDNFWTWFGSLPTGGQVAIGMMGGLITLRFVSAFKG